MKNTTPSFSMLAASTTLIGCLLVFNSCDKGTKENVMLLAKGFIVNNDEAGCNYLIRLENNTLLEPVIVDDPFFVFNVGMQVEVSYAISDEITGTCSGALPVHIKKMNNTGCNIAEFWPDVNGFVNDPLHKMKTLVINDDALHFTGELAGGCVNHAFRLVREGTCCDTSLTQPWDFYLFHDARNDKCNTIFPVKHCWNLSNLQIPDVDSVTFFVHYFLPDGPQEKCFTYRY